MTFRTVALTDTQAPDTEPGVDFSEFFRVAINSAERVVFTASLVGTGVTAENDAGVWSEGQPGLRLVARAGEAAGDTQGGVFFSDFTQPVINDAGRSAFGCFLTGPQVDASSAFGLWTETDSGLAKMARQGDPAPGTNPSAAFSLLATATPVLNSSGETAVPAQLREGDGVWLGLPGALDPVVLRGNPLPGTGGRPLSILTSLFFPSLNNAGQTVFSGVFVQGFGFAGGVWVGDPGAITAVAMTAQQAPGTSAVFADFGNLANGFLANPAMNNAGQVFFRAAITGTGVTGRNNIGIWSGTSGDLSLVARSNDHAVGAGGGVEFSGFPFDPVVASLLINGHGGTAFYATLTGHAVDASNDSGLWVHTNGVLRLVARAGDLAPGTVGDVRFLALGGASGDMGHTLNLAGNLAFRTSLVGPEVTGANDEGLWAEVDGVVQLVVREGQVFEVAPGDQRTVDDLLSPLVGTGNQDGRASEFNDAGQLVFALSFTDESSGVFVADTVPANNMPGDADGDGDVDLVDFIGFSDCVSGAAPPATIDCVTSFDLDSDGDVDLDDFALFEANFSGNLFP